MQYGESFNLIIKEILKYIMGHKRVIATYLTAILDTACKEEKLAIIDVNERFVEGEKVCENQNFEIKLSKKIPKIAALSI